MIFVCTSSFSLVFLPPVAVFRSEFFFLLNIRSKADRRKLKKYSEDIPSWLSTDFKSNFRMSSVTFWKVFSYLRTCPEAIEMARGSQPETLEKSLLSVLWYMGSQDTLSEICQRFSISEESFLNRRSKIMKALLSKSKENLIRWPEKDADKQIIAQEFETLSNLKNVIGVLDTTHIQVKALDNDREKFYNKNGYYSVKLIAACQRDMRFIFCSTGHAGRLHDFQTLVDSHLLERGAHLCNSHHLVGDAAFPLFDWLITPYTSESKTDAQQYYNSCLMTVQKVITRAFGLLHGRFRRLKVIESTNLSTIVDIIHLACVLHNFCIGCDDIGEEYMVYEVEDEGDDSLPVINLPPLPDTVKIKRDIICRNLSIGRHR